ncbi:hypothetical protein A2U01_0093141, partial [Trifolium medium]|nr:hypothetical protein [Trifolium medium]
MVSRIGDEIFTLPTSNRALPLVSSSTPMK